MADCWYVGTDGGGNFENEVQDARASNVFLLIVAEMFEGKYVATAMSLCSQLNWACNFIVGLVFPYMKEYLGPFSFGPFGVILACCFLYAWLVLPETQGTTPEKLIAEMMTRNSTSVVFDADMDPADAASRDWGKAMGQIQADERRQMETAEYGT